MSDQPSEGESKINAWGHEISFRGLLALCLVATLCVLTVLHPDLFSKAFESTVIAVVAFYFGQSTKK